jgi:hypothetical protein
VAQERAGLTCLAVGLAMIAWAQMAAPMTSPPLYDGVVVEEPYRYLSPAPGEAGDPTSFSGTKPLAGGGSPAFVGATGESPPQAQLIAQGGAFAAGAGASGLVVTITPVAPAVADAIAGNAYQFTVTDQETAAVPVAAGSFVTLALRAPADVTDVTIVRFASGAWQSLPTMRGGQPDVFLVNVDELGEFAVRGTLPSSGIDLGSWPRFIGVILAAGSVLVALGLLVPRRIRQDRSNPPPHR